MMTKPKVLIVEDDRIIAGVARWRLVSLGYDVCGSVTTGAEALACIPDMHPDIVLMDINLQGEIDGIETAGRIKKEFNIPVIFASSHTDEETISRAKEVDPDGFVRKPFDDDDLRIALELGLKK
jgi:two-component system, response regulator PdtaR